MTKTLNTQTQTPAAPATAPTPSTDGRRSDAKKAKQGSVWSRHSFGTVDHRIGGGLSIRNLQGLDWAIDQGLIEAEFSFADQWDVDVSLSRTKLLEILMKRTWTAMTVKFRKKVDMKEAANALFPQDNQGAGWNHDAKLWRERVETVMAGEERTMEGYHHGDLDPHGRLVFQEIVSEPGKPPVEQRRLVDPRTVFQVIVSRTRYTVEE